MSDIVQLLMKKPATSFAFPDANTFAVEGVEFSIDQDDEVGFFGPNVRLWADGIMVFQEPQIKVRGGMGTQVHNTYSAIDGLRDRVGQLRKERERERQEAKRSEVIALLQTPPTA